MSAGAFGAFLIGAKSKAASKSSSVRGFSPGVQKGADKRTLTVDGARVHLVLRPVAATAEKFNIINKFMANAAELKKDGPIDIAGRKAVGILRRRLLAGISTTGQPFYRLKKKGDPPKSNTGPRYAEWKAKALSRFPGAPGKTVKPPLANLYLTGDLYRSIRFWKSRANGIPGITIGVGHNRKKALALTFGHKGTTPPRPFIGFNRTEKRIVTDAFMKQMTRRFRAKLNQ